MGKSFHVYPNAPQAVDMPPFPYSRATPLQCDTIEFDTIGPSGAGHFDVGQHCYVADVAQITEFHVMVLFNGPNPGAQINVWLMKNILPPPDGSVGGEMCGDDVVVYQPGATRYNQTARVTRKMKLNAGDRVWAVPGCNGGGTLTGAIAGNGNNTVNYFEGHILELL